MMSMSPCYFFSRFQVVKLIEVDFGTVKCGSPFSTAYYYMSSSCVFFPNPKVDLQSFFKEKVVNSGELFSLSDVVSVARSVKCGPCWELTCSFPQNTKLMIIFHSCDMYLYLP